MKSNDPDLQWESEEEAVREKENPEECGVLDPGKESVSGRGREQLVNVAGGASRIRTLPSGV